MSDLGKGGGPQDVYHCFRNFWGSEGFFLSASRYDLLTILISACLTKIKDLPLMIEAVKYDLTDI